MTVKTFQMFQKKSEKITFNDNVTVMTIPHKKMSNQEISQRVNQILSGRKIRNIKII